MLLVPEYIGFPHTVGASANLDAWPRPERLSQPELNPQSLEQSHPAMLFCKRRDVFSLFALRIDFPRLQPAGLGNRADLGRMGTTPLPYATRQSVCQHANLGHMIKVTFNLYRRVTYE